MYYKKRVPDPIALQLVNTSILDNLISERYSLLKTLYWTGIDFNLFPASSKAFTTQQKWFSKFVQKCIGRHALPLESP